MARLLLLIFCCILFILSLASDINYESLWWQTIENETSLLNHMLHIANKIRRVAVNQSAYNITINTRFVQSIQTIPYDPLRIGYKLLLLMNIWYNHEIHKYAPVGSVKYVRIINSFRLNAHKIPKLLDLLTNAAPKSCKKAFRDRKHLLDQIFNYRAGHPSDFDIFYEWIYYDDYIAFISKKRLELMHKLGDGVQADVFLVRDTANLNQFALKIFNKHEHDSALREETILQRIEAEIHSNYTLSAKLHVPRIINDYKICAFRHNAILMEFIESVEFDDDTWSNPDSMRLMRHQIGKTIEILSSFGIGHFDIQKNNILLDVDGYFWIIDFGLAVNINLEWSIKQISTPLIGTWLFYSPYAFELSRFLEECKQKKIDFVPEDYRSVVVDHIKKADLYSLEALILHYTYARDSDLGKIHQRCQEIWLHKNESGITEEMLANLDEMWTRRRWMVQGLLMQKKSDSAATVLLFERE